MQCAHQNYASLVGNQDATDRNGMGVGHALGYATEAFERASKFQFRKLTVPFSSSLMDRHYLTLYFILCNNFIKCESNMQHFKQGLSYSIRIDIAYKKSRPHDRSR